MRTLDIIRDLLQHELFCVEKMIVGYRSISVNIIETPLAKFHWNFKARFGWCPFVVSDENIAHLTYDNCKVWSSHINECVDTVIKRCLPDRPSSDQHSPSGSSHRHSSSSEWSFTSVLSMEHPSEPSKDLPSISVSKQGGYKIKSVIGHPDLSDVFWHVRHSPNFFLCQPVTSTALKDIASKIQEDYCERYPNWRPLLYTPEMLHITLCTLSLPSISEVAKCFDCIRGALTDPNCPVVNEPLVLSGLGHFGSSVLYVAVKHSKSLTDLVSFLNDRLRESGFGDCVGDHFTPHVTLLKRSSKSTYRHLKVDRSFVESFDGTTFGLLEVDRLWLCLMGKSRDENGFYRTFGQLELTPASK